MAITFVQSNTVAGGGAGPSLNCPFLSDNAAGNFIVVVAAATNSGAANISVSDTQGNVYQSTAKITATDGISTIEGQLFYAVNVKAGANTVNVTQNGAGGTDLLIYEFSSVSSLDGSHSASGAGNAEDSGPLTTTNANDLLIGYFAGTSVNSGSDAPGIGWTGTVRSGGQVCICAEYQIVSAIGTYDATFTSSALKGFSNSWAAMIVAFSGTGAGPISSSPCGMLMGVGV